MKIFKSKNFKALIYSIFLSLPILTILGRTIYTIANKNAKDSYYGETINEKEYINESINDLELTKEYSLITNRFTGAETTPFFFMYVENFKDNITGISNENVSEIRVFYTSSYILRVVASTGTTDYNLSTSDVNVSFTNLGIYNYSGNISQYNFFYSIEYNKYSYLDNAFEYSIDKFTHDNNFGKLNFFEWFSTLFLNNNQVNNLFIHFINWYMNYILYVSLAYLLFAVLMWFVNFFRSLVEKNMDLDL